VNLEDTRLDSDWAEAIMGDLDPEAFERLKPLVPSREWLKYSLFNFALDWVVDQALTRMKIEQKMAVSARRWILKTLTFYV